MHPDNVIDLLKSILGFQGVTNEHLQEVARQAAIKRYAKGALVFSQHARSEFLGIVIHGLVKIYSYSATGKRITYLLAGDGDTLDLVGLFTTQRRLLSGESMEESLILQIKREVFLDYVYEHPLVINNIMTKLGYSIDSANEKILDMIEKRVEQRLLKVLFTLQKKFGNNLKFTSSEFADLAGTTIESTLRAMAQFRKLGIIQSGRGEVTVLAPKLIEIHGDKTYWI